VTRSRRLTLWSWLFLALVMGCRSGPRPEALPSARPEALPQRAEPPDAASRRQACKAGDGDACNRLAVDYEYGHDVPKDEAEAAALYGLACDAGNAVGCDNLGQLYAGGKGLAADALRAVAFYRRACDGGLPLGCEHLRSAPGGDPGAQPAPPPFDGLYRGDLGDKKVLVLVEGTAADPPLWGRYAYLHVGTPISLRGTLQGDSARLEEVRPQDLPEGEADVWGRWSGTFSPTGFRGEWTSPDGARRRPIALSLVTRGTGRGTALDDAFHGELARLNLVPEEREVVAGDVAYRLVRQTRADVAYPRLSRHPDAAVMARVNSDLETRHLSSAAHALSCSPSVCSGCEHHEAVQLGFSPAFLSLWVSGNGSCGGPHPVDWADAVTYDLKTGATVELAKEFVLTTSRGALRRAVVPVFLRHLGPNPPEWRQQIADCYGDDTEPAVYQVLLSLADAGLRVATSFALHQESACAAEAVIPFGELERFRRKNSPYRFETAP
jgi:Sel1 repeat-containing protein